MSGDELSEVVIGFGKSLPGKGLPLLKKKDYPAALLSSNQKTPIKSSAVYLGPVVSYIWSY